MSNVLQISPDQHMWVAAYDGQVAVEIVGVSDYSFVDLTVEEAIRLSRMIVKAAAEAAGIRRPPEALETSYPSTGTHTT